MKTWTNQLRKELKSPDLTYERYIEIVKSNPILFGEIYIKPLTANWDTKTADHQYIFIENILRHTRSITHVPVEHAKSTWISLVMPLWFLANDKNLNIVIISSTATQAEKFVRLIKLHIEQNKLLREDFKHLRPHPDYKWTNTEIFIKRDDKEMSKDASILGIGTGGAFLGARVDILIGDDICSLDNSSTQHMRDKLLTWFNEIADSRITKNGRTILLGTLQNLKDLLCEKSQKHWDIQQGVSKDELKPKDYHYVNLKGFDTENNIPLWEDQWTVERHQDKIDSIGSVAYNKTIMNNRDENINASLDVEWITYYKPSDLPKFNFSIYIGFDPAIAKSKQTAEEAKQDHCALVVLMECHITKHLYMIEEHIEYLTFPEQLRLIQRKYMFYSNKYEGHPIKIGIETVYYQLALAQQLFMKKLPVFAVNVHNDKLTRIMNWAVEVENGRFRVLPSFKIFHQQYSSVEPGMNDSPDLIDACVIATALTKPSASLTIEEKEALQHIKIC